MLVVKIIIQPWYALKAAEMSGWEYLRQGLARPLIVGAMFFAVAGTIPIRAEANVRLFATAVGFQAIVFLACALVFGLTRSERQWLWGYARQRLGSPAVRQWNLLVSAPKPVFDDRE
jgi:hypothetical protein